MSHDWSKLSLALSGSNQNEAMVEFIKANCRQHTKMSEEAPDSRERELHDTIAQGFDSLLEILDDLIEDAADALKLKDFEYLRW